MLLLIIVAASRTLVAAFLSGRSSPGSGQAGMPDLLPEAKHQVGQAFLPVPDALAIVELHDSAEVADQFGNGSDAIPDGFIANGAGFIVGEEILF